MNSFGFPRGWRVDDAGEKLDGEFFPETPGEAARRRIDSVLNILDDWDDWTTDMGGDEDEDGREDLEQDRPDEVPSAPNSKGPGADSMISPKDFASIRVRFAEERTVRGIAI